MNEILTELIYLIVDEGIETHVLDRIANVFYVDAASIVVLKDFDITYSKVSSYFKKRNLDLIKLYKHARYRNFYFEEAIRKGYVVVNNYQAAVYANPLWKKAGLKSVLLFRLDTEFNAVFALDVFEKDRAFSEDDLKRLKSLSPFISQSLENTIFKELLNREITQLDISLPTGGDRESLRRWIRSNLFKVMELTRSKAVSLVYPEHNIYSFISGSEDIDFIRFKKDKITQSLLTYSVYEKRIKAPVVFVYGLSGKMPDHFKIIYDKLGIKHVLIIPLWENEKLLGVLGYGYTNDLHFSIYDVKLVRLLAKRLFQIVDFYKRLERMKYILTESEREIINSFVLTIEMRDTYTKGHSQRVAFYASQIANKLGLKRIFVDKVYTAGLLHDLGKISIPDAVLMKPSRLSKVEYEMVKYHSTLSYEIVSQLKSLKDLKTIANIVRHHHERCDGEGYPDGLKCHDISKGARILAIADVFDALTTTRPYRKAYSVDEALEIMKKDTGHFDEALFKRSIDILVRSYKDANRISESSLIPSAFEKYKKRFSHIDSLTGLLTRTAFLNHVDELMSTGRGFKVYMIDVKNMDFINMRCGSNNGDLILIETANALRSLSRVGGKFFSRYGGDSFVFIVEDEQEHRNGKEISNFFKNLPQKVLSTMDCPEDFSYSVASVDSKDAENAQELIYLLRKRKKRISKSLED